MAADMQQNAGGAANNPLGDDALGLQSMMKDLSGTLPGIDEAMRYDWFHIRIALECTYSSCLLCSGSVLVKTWHLLTLCFAVLQRS